MNTAILIVIIVPVALVVVGLLMLAGAWADDGKRQ